MTQTKVEVPGPMSRLIPRFLGRAKVYNEEWLDVARKDCCNEERAEQDGDRARYQRLMLSVDDETKEKKYITDQPMELPRDQHRELNTKDVNAFLNTKDGKILGKVPAFMKILRKAGLVREGPKRQPKRKSQKKQELNIMLAIEDLKEAVRLYFQHAQAKDRSKQPGRKTVDGLAAIFCINSSAVKEVLFCTPAQFKKEQLESFQYHIDELTKAKIAAERRVEQAETDVGKLVDDVNEINEDLTGMDTRLDEAEDAIEKLKEDFQQLQKDYQQLKENMGEYNPKEEGVAEEDAQRFQKLQERRQELEKEIMENIQKRMDEKLLNWKQDVLKEVEDKLKTHKEEIQVEIQAKFNQLQQQIQKLQEEQNQRMDRVEENVEELGEDVELLKAVQKEQENAQEEQDKMLRELKAKVNDKNIGADGCAKDLQERIQKVLDFVDELAVQLAGKEGLDVVLDVKTQAGSLILKLKDGEDVKELLESKLSEPLERLSRLEAWKEGLEGLGDDMSFKEYCHTNFANLFLKHKEMMKLIGIVHQDVEKLHKSAKAGEKKAKQLETEAKEQREKSEKEMKMVQDATEIRAQRINKLIMEVDKTTQWAIHQGECSQEQKQKLAELSALFCSKEFEICSPHIKKLLQQDTDALRHLHDLEGKLGDFQDKRDSLNDGVLTQEQKKELAGMAEKTGTHIQSYWGLLHNMFGATAS